MNVSLETSPNFNGVRAFRGLILSPESAGDRLLLNKLVERLKAEGLIFTDTRSTDRWALDHNDGYVAVHLGPSA